MSLEPAPASILPVLEAHERWRAECWNLIASENTPSSAVEHLLANDLSHRYGDYEGIDLAARKYRGNRFIVQIEQSCQELACRLFHARHAELRPLSGHIAGIAPLLALCKPSDAVVELDQESGGHRLAAKMVNCPLVQMRTLQLPFDPEQFNIDVPRALDLIEKERPRLVILGSSLFLFPHPVSQLRDGIRALGVPTLLQYDASHVLGLIAGGRFQHPLDEGADLISSSTHKTLGGPQGGLILTNSTPLAEAIGRAVQPGLQSNHHLHRIPALHQTLLEWAGDRHAEAARVIETAQALAAAIERQGIPVVGAHLGYTASHTVIVPAQRFGPAPKLALALEEANIIAGSCRLPGALGPDGLRFGTQEFVRRGLLSSDADEVASVIGGVLKRELDGAKARERVRALLHRVAGRHGSEHHV